MRVGLGHDTHRLVEGRRLILGGVVIEYEKGLFGHSDADAVLHAVTDALLGAAGLGDIGELFPDTDPSNRDVESGTFVLAALDAIKQAGWRPINFDITVHAERPKLSSYKRTMAESIARLVGLDPSAVNVKAKTGERVGPIGRGEAISCDAIVLIEPIPSSPVA